MNLFTHYFSTLLHGCLLFLFAGSYLAQQNLNQNYIPLKSSGQLPVVFTQNVRDVIKQDITGLKEKKDRDRAIKSAFLTASNYQIEKLLRSGDVLVNDEITTYLNQIVDVILKDNPTLRKQLYIFALKSPVVNAYSYDKGFIFIDVGLIAQLETEAQLAYILCHEICHYTKQHHINSFVLNEYLDRNSYKGDSEARYIEKCQYSKENESEADLEGFVLFERTLYNLKQAEKIFDVLQYSHLPFELVEFDKSYFETPGYILPDKYFLKRVAPIRDNSNEDDEKHTHPNTKKRREAITKIVAERDNSTRVNSIVGEKKFAYIRDLSRMEMCRLYLKIRDYPNALYASYILSKEFPNNYYLQEMLSKSLYGLALYANGEVRYNDDSKLDDGIVSYKEIESYPQQIYHLVEHMPPNEWAVLALNYVYRLHKKFPDNKPVAAVSDSLFGVLARAKWGVTEFDALVKKEAEPRIQTTGSTDTLIQIKSKTDLIKSMQKEDQSIAKDTFYYRSVFDDLFATDTVFKRKFPTTPLDEITSGTFKVYSASGSSNTRINRNIRLKRKHSVDTVLLLEPFYVKVDERYKQSVQYITSDEKQENYMNTIDECAGLLNVQLIKLDPGLMTAAEVDKMNDFSTINDWFDERFDSDAEGAVILNTNDVAQVMAKYGTNFVLRTGIASVINMQGKKRTFFFAFLYDLSKNKMVYRKFEIFKRKDHRDLVRAKAYQVLFDLKHPVK